VNTPEPIPLRLWVAFWRAAQRYFRYRVEGIERLVDAPPSLIVGYHGRPVAWDPSMLTVALYDRLGYLPHGFLHRGVDAIPPLRWFADGMGFVTRDDPRLRAAIARGEHLIVTPGGANEGCRSYRHNYRVNWEGHAGYVRLAAKYGLPIVPVAAAGVDDAYVGLTDADALGRRLGLPRDWTWVPWLGWGPIGIFPFSPPFPVRIHQLIGTPIPVPRRAEHDRTVQFAVHARVTRAMQDLMDRARARAAAA
jgi:1-acyl-sn-glycerol-3-phosphate acyltransferase